MATTRIMPLHIGKGALRAEQSAILLIMWQIRKRLTTEN
mgnify:FL=1